MQQDILNAVNDAIKAASQLKEKEGLSFIEKASDMIADAYRKGSKLIIAGNGGSLCDAMHFAEELTGQFRLKRQALPAIALSDVGHLSCTANDYGYEHVFARGIEAHGRKDDIFIALTTSGNSQNLILAAKMAKEYQMKTIAFLGKEGGKMRGMCDLEWIIRGFTFSDRIQEAHMAAIHIIIEMVEKLLFYSKKPLSSVSQVLKHATSHSS